MSKSRLRELIYLEPASVARSLLWISLLLTLIIMVPSIIMNLVSFIRTGNFPKQLIDALIAILVFPAFSFVLGIVLAHSYNYIARKGKGIEYIVEDSIL